MAKLQQPSIIAVQETWADPSDSDGMYAINGYKLIRADRDTFGGGVATYIPHSCQHETITIPMTQAECIWIRITISQASLVVGNIYRPPRSDPAEFVMELERAIKLVERPQDEILLLGDFNAKNWLWHPSDTTDALGEDLHWLCETRGLTQHVSFATHLRQHTPTSCLDLAISSLSRHNITITSLPPMGASDHVVIQGNIRPQQHTTHRNNNTNNNKNESSTTQQSTSSTYWLWSEERIASLREALATCNLQYDPHPTDPQPVTSFWNFWRDQILKLAVHHCQVTRSKSRKNSTPTRPWMTKDLLSQIKTKHKQFRTYKATQLDSDWKLYTAQRNRVTALLRQAKSDFVQQTTSTGTNLHRLLKHLKKPPKQTIPTLSTANSTAATAMEKATALNKFFISQSQQSIDRTTCTTPDINTTPDISHTLNTIAATVEEVEKLLCSLDTGKSPGFDNIPTRLLKETAKEISPSLTSLYNLSFRTRDIPQDWKDATITPIPKSGNPSHPTNYRPISLLSIISKTQEKIVHSRLYNHIAPHLPSNQSGFRKQDGTELQLARIVQQISAARDAGKHVVTCFFDLSKAFDPVWHQGLLKKLSHYGVDGKAHNWLEAYLTGRRQRVQVEGTTSTFIPIPAGVPQGSVLGPLLFLAYTIDLPTACENATTSCSQFADDTALIAIAGRYIECEDALQGSVDAAAEWLERWHLLVNKTKTVILPFYHANRSPPRLPKIKLGQTLLETVTQHRQLGIIFQHDLRWSAHLDFVLKKAVKSFNILFRLKSTLHAKSLSLIYKTYILPIIEYACIAVTPLSITALDRLERIQRKAARICLRLPLYTPLDHSTLLHRLKWPTMFSRRKVKLNTYACSTPPLKLRPSTES